MFFAEFGSYSASPANTGYGDATGDFVPNFPDVSSSPVSFFRHAHAPYVICNSRLPEQWPTLSDLGACDFDAGTSFGNFSHNFSQNGMRSSTCFSPARIPSSGVCRCRHNSLDVKKQRQRVHWHRSRSHHKISRRLPIQACQRTGALRLSQNRHSAHLLLPLLLFLLLLPRLLLLLRSQPS